MLKFKNWKTSFFGISAIISGVALFIKGDSSAALASIASGIGLIFAKDHNTGTN